MTGIADDGAEPMAAHPDRLFPAEERTRGIARDLYAEVAEAPILSPHGHVDPRILLDDRPFADPADLFITHDHYVTRLLHAGGVELARLGLGPHPDATPREVWRAFCAHWHLFAGTASGYWLQDTLTRVLGVDTMPSAGSADRLFDTVSAQLRTPELAPRALFRRFRIEVLATTDDPLDDLAVHRSLTETADLGGRVIPTFRPDRFLDASQPGWADAVSALAAATGNADGDHAGFLEGLRERRQHFIRHGAVSADHGVDTPLTVDLDRHDAERLFARALRGDLRAADAAVLQGHLLLEMARMSVDDGLVMTLHPGVTRGHHRPTAEAFGPDTGHDIPHATTFTEDLRPLLNRFGTAPGFRLILFTVDETAFSREIAPLAGFYPSVRIGAPWWFLDAPDAIQRFRAATTETAGFHRGSGFIDDTRAFLSIPARHDMSRRLDAAFLARLVAEERLSLRQAGRIARDLVSAIPREAFRL